jgi:hypothetical protein
MKDCANKNFLSRMKARNIFTALALALALSNCSSKHGASNTSAKVGDDVSENQMQAEEDMMLGDSDTAQSEEVASSDESLDAPTSSASDASGEINSLPESSEGSDGAEASEKVAANDKTLPDGSPSLPVSYNKDAPIGSLKSTYEPGQTVWTVSRGESLSLIAGAVYGKTKDWPKLVALNPGVDPNSLKVGQKLRLPSSDDAAQNEQASTEAAPKAVAKTKSHKNKPEQVEEAPKAAAEVPVVANNEAPVAAAPTETIDPNAAAPAPAPAEEGAMGTVDPVAQQANEAPSADGALSGIVKKVDAPNKIRLRNILLGVAAFFLLLSGLIFVMSRRKAKVG